MTGDTVPGDPRNASADMPGRGTECTVGPGLHSGCGRGLSSDRAGPGQTRRPVCPAAASGPGCHGQPELRGPGPGRRVRWPGRRARGTQAAGPGQPDSAREPEARPGPGGGSPAAPDSVHPGVNFRVKFNFGSERRGRLPGAAAFQVYDPGPAGLAAAGLRVGRLGRH